MAAEAVTPKIHLQVDIILNDHNEWPYFIQIIQQEATDLSVWQYIDVNESTQPTLLVKPTKPPPLTGATHTADQMNL